MRLHLSPEGSLFIAFSPLESGEQTDGRGACSCAKAGERARNRTQIIEVNKHRGLLFPFGGNKLALGKAVNAVLNNATILKPWARKGLFSVVTYFSIPCRVNRTSKGRVLRMAGDKNQYKLRKPIFRLINESCCGKCGAGKGAVEEALGEDFSRLRRYTAAAFSKARAAVRVSASGQAESLFCWASVHDSTSTHPAHTHATAALSGVFYASAPRNAGS